MADVRLQSLPDHPSPIEPDSIMWVERENAGSFISEKQEHKVILIRKYLSQVDTYTAEPGDAILPDNSGGSVTINLPASPNTGDTVYFKQVLDQPFSTNNLIVGRNGNTIMGLSEDMTVTTDNIEFHMEYNGTTWVVIKDKIVGTTL